MSRIYALIDAGLMNRSGLSAETVASFLHRHDIPVAQYRDKNSELPEMLEKLKLFRALYRGRLIVNDRMELAGYADGLHLGQEDLRAVDPDPQKAVSKIRTLIGDGMLGLSTHTLDEIVSANDLDLDYIGLGAYRPTSTKSGAMVSGKALLGLAGYSRHPVAVIGGVRWEDAFPETVEYRVLGSALFEKICEEMEKGK
jgi:thiamine-phosphate pyrophosphorylase